MSTTISRQRNTMFACLALLAACSVSLAKTPSGAEPGAVETPPAEQVIADFELRDVWGKQHKLSDYAEADVIVVAFLGTECPLAKLYGPRLEQLAQEFAGRKVQVLGIDANQQDSIAEMAAYARTHGLLFPLLKDVGNEVADRFGALRTPEAFVLDGKRRVVYRGRIDDQFGIDFAREKPRKHFLKEALEDQLAGREIRRPQTEPVGCFIGRVRKPDETSKITWSNQISRLFQKHCVECHREGDIGPFSLTEYDQLAGWGPTIEEVIQQQRMPPWHADPAHGDFRNTRGMTDEEKQLVYDWVAAGCPEGDPSQLPAPREFQTGWQLKEEPDVVIPMRDRPFVVAAEGAVDYQYFVVDPEFKEDKWIAGAEIVPGNRAVVHHAIVFIRPPDDADFRGIGWLSAYVPGQRIEKLEPGLARRVPAGSKLVFQMHYTPNGSEQQDQSRLGLIFAEPDSVREEVTTILSLNQTFEIPPEADDYAVETKWRRFPSAGRLLAIAPHMHVRGKAFRVEAQLPDGTTEILLDVPHYDFNWQSTYVLAKPRRFPAETKVRCIARFDNSDENLNNPDPSQAVRWGDQTWEEMALGFFAVTRPLDAKEDDANPDDKLSPEQLAEAKTKARKLLKDLDADGDGRARRSETTEQFARFAFSRYDTDDNGVLTLEELTKATEKSLRRKQQRQRR
ncbi:MAG TPA: redoxin domain-containing protein [Pirellulales bacterium]|nr:redoxin domain-containing protein [Pirellulales bacterium]